MKTVVGVMMVLGFVSLSALADTYVLDSSLSGRDDIDWTVASSYSGSHSRNPATGDLVEIPAGMVAKVVAGSGSWELVNSLSRIVPKDGAVFEVVVPDEHEGVAVLGIPVTEHGLSDAANSGTLRKTGGGTLELASYRNVKDGNLVRDYYLNIAVDGGDLHLYKGGTDENEDFMFKDITVSDAGTLHICYFGDTNCDNLNGTGCVTLDNTTAKNPQNLYINGEGYSSFDGWMTGPKLRIDIVAGRHDITCPTNTINTICFGQTGICGFTRLGADNTVPSSLGTGNFNFSSHSGVIYLGNEVETSSKTFWLNSNSFIDAGAHGGLTLKGKLDSSGDATLLRTFTLLGSNDNPCVISGTFPARANQKNVFYIKKKGTGTWRMAHHATRGSLGVFDVEDGTLQFDTIAEKGEPCSLGYATNLFQECIHKAYETGVPVNYAMILGGNGTEGTLEYTGTAAAGCETRPIAVRSKGRFKTTDVAFRLCDVYALGNGERTLTLESSLGSGYGSMATKLSDGTDGGSLSVVKEGEGVWQLIGTNTFTGSAISRDGTLLINNPSSKYKWYRLVVMENAYSCDRYNTTYSVGTNELGEAKTISDEEKAYVQIVHLALYDEDGNNLVKGFKQKFPVTQFAFEGGDARVMEPGEVALGQLGSYSGYKDPSQLLQNLFDRATYPATGKLPGGKGGVKKDDPSTWLPIVVRLPDDAPAAVRMDFQCGRNRSGIGSYNGRNMTAFRLDASADGINWDEGVAQNLEVNVPEYFPKWDSDGTDSIPVDGVRKDKGMVLSRTATETESPDRHSFTSVGAANGGVVKVVGAAYQVSGLVVDASAAPGTISNFVFAASGTVDVLNAELAEDGTVDLPGDYSHLEGVSNIAQWSLTLDGEICPSRFVGVKDGRLCILRRGLRVIFR